MKYRPTSLFALLASAALIAIPSAASADELITNGNFNSGLTGFNTTYDQTNDGGFLILTTDPHLLCGSCFPSIGDHTTGTGNMVFVDGAGVGDGGAPGSHPYYSVTLAVVPGSNYTFSYFAANLGPSDQPVPLLATYLNGGLLGAPSTPNFDDWTQYSFLFNSGALSSVTLSLSDLTATHSFNDFVFDDVSLQGPLPGTPGGVPEPSSWAMMLLGFGAIGIAARSARRKRPATA